MSAALQMSALVLAIEPPDRPDTAALLAALDAHLSALYPPESNHFLDLAALQSPDIRFFVARRAGEALGCGALRLEGGGFGEVKRMFVALAARGLGLGRALLAAIEEEARRRGLHTLRLETGIHQQAALGLYRAAGFAEIAPFGEYRTDRLSLCFTKVLA